MKPRRFHGANRVFRLEGGTEDNDLWIQQLENPYCMVSVWELTDEDRAAIAAGANVELRIWGNLHPPCAVNLTEVPLGKPPTLEGGEGQ